ncbi:MAG: endothelin-converting protein [Methanotrichaceae archaeon]|nr:endothelin-converting protein [Methanotrichaceae archaeon]
MAASDDETSGNHNDTRIFDPANMNLSVRPGDEFYEYVNGGWIDSHPVPPDKSSYGEFRVVRDRTDEQVRELVEAAKNNTAAEEGSTEQMIGEFYRVGLDTAALEFQDIGPLEDEISRIDNISTVADVQNVSARLLGYYIIDPFFALFADSDPKNSKMMMATLFQSGLGLPDRDFYFRMDNDSIKTRDDYLEHVARMFILLGDAPEVAQDNARTIMRMETRLANASFTNVENRDPLKTYNRMTLDELSSFAPGYDWKAFVVNIGHPEIREINVMNPPFVKELGAMMQDEDLADWKTFLRWKLISATAPYLSSSFENESFDFNFRKLNGQEQMEPRWKRVLKTETSFLGEPIGQLYVQKYFDWESKARMIDMVANLKKAFRYRLQNLTWMEDSTKEKALEKLDTMDVKVGYPDKWRDFSGLVVKNDSYVMNVLRAGRFEFEHGNYGLDKVGKPVDRDAWFMPPQAVNAYNDPMKNTIVFPAGILQPPFFNRDADDAVNYGAIGVVIGHEMIHGFDDQGRQYDRDGNLTDWWTQEDSDRFNQSTRILVEEYSNFEALPDLYVNGNLTLGENIADFGGLTMSYQAYRISLKEEPEKIDGLSGDQRFFMSYAQIWRESIKDEKLRTLVLTDPHSPTRFRVNGALFNVPEFYQAFPEISPGDRLYRQEDQRPVIW